MKRAAFWKKSIFKKTLLILLPLVLLIDGLVLFAGYREVYNATYSHAEEDVSDSANLLKESVSYIDVEKDDKVSDLLEGFCKYTNTTYAYILEADPEKDQLRFLAIDFGKDATEEAKKERYPGVVVSGNEEEEFVDKEMRIALEQPEEGCLRHEKNRFGDTLIYYLRLKEHYDDETQGWVDYDKNIVVGVEISLSNILQSFQNRYNFIVVVTLVLTVAILFVLVFILFRRISVPLQRISRRMREFLTEDRRDFKELPVRGDDEFAEVSRSFNTMAKNIDGYLGSIEELNREKHTREAELNIAGDIQLGLLRPSHAEGEGFRINARMLPAKDVGGDLYDYQILPDGRVFLAIADVSGKGITASLFMSRAVTLLDLYAKMGYSPAHILQEYNNTLAEQNAGNLFITTFVAVYDRKTHELTYANGGHNTPYVLSDTLIPLDGADGIAAGVFAGEEYAEATLTLREGDQVFLFTDGVNEAQNKDGDLFTTETLEEELSRHLGKNSKDLIPDVQERVMGFVNGAERSDDMTMLCFRLTGNEEGTSSGSERKNAAPEVWHKVLHLPADVEQLPLLIDTVGEIPGLTDERKMEMEVMCEEIFVNICSYAYPNGGGEAEITIDVDDRITIIFTDEGIPFDPQDRLPDVETFDHLNTRGGLGRFISFEVADEHSYDYKDGKNVLKLVKYRE
ncbi:MAG: SpoIIE family protein phosphatase [Eubacterium sp.]|nr:SpoIIE family protein phosphatase [Eubacterium sp.]